MNEAETQEKLIEEIFEDAEKATAEADAADTVQAAMDEADAAIEDTLIDGVEIAGIPVDEPEADAPLFDESLLTDDPEDVPLTEADAEHQIPVSDEEAAEIDAAVAAIETVATTEDDSLESDVPMAEAVVPLSKANADLRRKVYGGHRNR